VYATRGLLTFCILESLVLPGFFVSPQKAHVILLNPDTLSAKTR